MLFGQIANTIVIDLFGLRIDAVKSNMIKLARKVDRRAVGQVPTMFQIHSQNRIAGFEHRQIDRHVGLRTGMGLDIHMIGLEQLFGPVARQIFGDIDKLAPAVIALAGIAFGIFHRHHTPQRFQHPRAHQIFGRNQLQLVFEAIHFVPNRPGDLGIKLRQG